MRITLCFLFILFGCNIAYAQIPHQYSIMFNGTCRQLVIASEHLIITILNTTNIHPHLVWITNPYNISSIDCNYKLSKFTDLTYVYISVALTCLSVCSLTTLGMFLACRYFKRKSRSSRRIYRNMI